MRIEYIALYARDLEEARDFSVQFLGGTSNNGYHNKTTGFRSYFISFDDGARLGLMNKPEMEDPDKPLNRVSRASEGVYPACATGGQEVAGPNPVHPTTNGQPRSLVAPGLFPVCHTCVPSSSTRVLF